MSPDKLIISKVPRLPCNIVSCLPGLAELRKTLTLGTMIKMEDFFYIATAAALKTVGRFSRGDQCLLQAE